MLLVTADRLHLLLPQKLFEPQISTLIVSFLPVHRLPIEGSTALLLLSWRRHTRLMKVTAERAAIVLNYKVKCNYLFHAVLRVVAAALYGASKLGRFLMVRWLYNRT